MSKINFRRLNDLNTRQRAVYEAVPMQEWWPPHVIVTELTRLGRTWSVTHCLRVLNDMARMGVVKKRQAGKHEEFQRTPLRELRITPSIERKNQRGLAIVTTETTPSFEGLLCLVEDARNSLQQAQTSLNESGRRLQAVAEYVEKLEGVEHKNKEVDELKLQVQALMKRVEDM